MFKKKLSTIIIIVILILFNIPFINSAPEEGYGEGNNNLGQFTDTFENTDNITVMDDVIRNTTLECIELEFGGPVPIPEYYNDFTEVDIVADRITIQNDTWVEHHAERDEETYLYRDYGTDYFDDFTHDFSFESEYDQVGGIGNPYVLSQTVVNDVFDMFQTGGEKSVDIRLYRHGSIGNQFILYYFSGGGGVGGSDTWNGPTSNILYHIRIVKNGASLWLGVYSTIALRNAGDGTDGDVTNLSVNLGSDLKFRYIYAVATWNDGQNYFMNYDVYNLFIGTVGGGYEEDGYFITEDYLDYTTGNSLALLSNASIPEGTTLTVQFSNDNLTWVDNEGNVGSTPILDGFYAIDLRDLDYTDNYKMVNFTGTPALTPRLYQLREITTIGNYTIVEQNVTGEWIEYNLTAIDVLIGVHDTGDLNSTLEVDGDTFNCSETTGSPAWVVSFNWTDVDIDANCLWVTGYIYYDGTNNHVINIDLYNFTSSSWVTIGEIVDMVGFEWVNVSIYDLRMPNDFINSTGAVLGRFNHVSNGNINDDIYIEYLKLSVSIPTDIIEVILEDYAGLLIIGLILGLILGIGSSKL